MSKSEAKTVKLGSYAILTKLGSPKQPTVCEQFLRYVRNLQYK